MKSVIALFLGVAAAVKVQDAPPYFNEPTWTERMPSAGGFLQLNACINSGIAGVTCSPPNSQLSTVTTAQMELTALERSAPELTDQLMAHPEPHAPESNQKRSHIITPTQPPEDHTRPVVTSAPPPPRPPAPTHGQDPRLSSKPP